MDRALRRDYPKLFDLLLAAAVRKPQHDAEVGSGAALGCLVLAIDLEMAEVPSLAVGIHLHGDRSAGGNAGSQQFLRTGAFVDTAQFRALVGGEPMTAYLDLMSKAACATPRSRLH